MSVFLISLAVSFFLILLIIRFKSFHLQFTSDSDFDGIQKFHLNLSPRVGGIAILIASFASLLFRFFIDSEVAIFGLTLLTCSLPVFIFGAAEDLTKSVSARLRLLASLVSTLLMGYFMNGWLVNVHVYGLDYLIESYLFVSILLTCFAVVGLTNAFNLIDGFNGLSCMVGLLILASISYVAFKVNDHAVMIAAFSLMGGLIGFFLFNYPRGLIFLGDCGAYLIGFWVGSLSIMLTNRNPQVSSWFPLLLCIYPICETIFSIYRRSIFRRVSLSKPDALHLHQLIFYRLVRWPMGKSPMESQLIRNSLTSPFLWVLTFASAVPALLFWENQLILIIFVFLFIISYIFFYRSIAMFRVPRWLIIQKKQS